MKIGKYVVSWGYRGLSEDFITDDKAQAIEMFKFCAKGFFDYLGREFSVEEMRRTNAFVEIALRCTWDTSDEENPILVDAEECYSVGIDEYLKEFKECQ